MPEELSPPMIPSEVDLPTTREGEMLRRGRGGPRSADEQEHLEPHVDHIPWSYGKDRVTAMAVDPNRMFVYWEVSDEAITKGREGLGAGGKDAWLNLRVYDVTHRIFDGTNAHMYLDIKVERSDRQWFLHLGKPGSAHVVELGLKSFEGYFVKLVRSGRAELPRFEPVGGGPVDWLTVTTRTGAVDGVARGEAPGSSGGPHGQRGGGGGGPGGPGGPGEGGGVHTRGAVTNGMSVISGTPHVTTWTWGGWKELLSTQWIEGRRFFEWSSPLERTSWEAGPFTVPVALPAVEVERHEGPVIVQGLEGGRTRVIYGPWEVVIRGVGAHAERRIISRWEVHTSWVVNMGYERVLTDLKPGSQVGTLDADGNFVPGSGSDLRLGGASERMWMSASELRLLGASELYRIGASELRFGGATEMLFAGATEWRSMGGSERYAVGASEYRIAGENAWAALGASEYGMGASDRMWPGSSDLMIGGSDIGASPSYPSPQANEPSPERK